jgi:hypothetical protein
MEQCIGIRVTSYKIFLSKTVSYLYTHDVLRTERKATEE